MNTESIIERFQELGMSGYEAKAYVALVAAGEPLNGYEVAKRSGVPRSTVYETLGKLTASGATYEVRTGDDSVSYLPLPPKSLLDRLGRRFESTVTSLREALPSITAPPRLHLIHNLAGRSMVIERARDVVSGARHDLFVSAWPEELLALDSLLLAAEDRGIPMSVMSFGESPRPVERTYVHKWSSPDIVLENLGCRLFVAVADRQQAVMGGFDGDDAWGIYTDNPAVVTVAVEYVRHDIALQLMGEYFDDAEVMKFWQSNPELNRLRSDHGSSAAALRAARSTLSNGAASTKRAGARAGRNGRAATGRKTVTD